MQIAGAKGVHLQGQPGPPQTDVEGFAEGFCLGFRPGPERATDADRAAAALAAIELPAQRWIRHSSISPDRTSARKGGNHRATPTGHGGSEGAQALPQRTRS